MGALPSAAEFLIVDENDGMAEFLRSYLLGKNHSCHALRQVEGVQQWLAENQCEIAIVDLKMRSSDSQAIVSTIRQANAKLPIIVFTAGSTDDEQKQGAIRAGANGYVSKNLPLGQLYCVLTRVLAAARFQARRIHPRRALLGPV